jgi:hypothetical protein
MNTVRLRRIGKEYHNKHYRTISSIFSLHDRKISACASLTFPSCSARKWLSPTCRFRQNVVIEFLVREGHPAEIMYERLLGVCMGASSVTRWVEHLEDGNTDIADQPRCGRPRAAATERTKQEVDELIRRD